MNAWMKLYIDFNIEKKSLQDSELFPCRAVVVSLAMSTGYVSPFTTFIFFSLLVLLVLLKHYFQGFNILYSDGHHQSKRMFRMLGTEEKSSEIQLLSGSIHYSFQMPSLRACLHGGRLPRPTGLTRWLEGLKHSPP